MSRVCSVEGCGKVLGPNNRSGFCRPHNTSRMNSDPEFTAKRLAGVKVAATASRGSAWRSQAAKKAAAKRLAQPGYLEKLQEHLDSIRHRQWDCPEKRARRIAKLSQSMSDKRLPWCPREYRPLYREIRGKGVDVETARAAVEDTIARDRAKALAERNTFAAKLARVQSGEAGLTDAFQRHHLTPTVRRAA